LLREKLPGMGRQRQPEIRARLLDACTRHLLDHGLPMPSLRVLADAAGTSPRMLIYHFTTRDRLVREALVEARRRQRELFDDALRHRPGRPYADTLAAAWAVLTAEEATKYVRLFFDVHALPATEAPWPDFPVMATRDWLPTIEEGLRADGHPDPGTLATLTLAVVRGLFLDERSTAERDRAAAAFRTFVAMLQDSGNIPTRP
jgi:AcrR family transcriptional regulator